MLQILLAAIILNSLVAGCWPAVVEELPPQLPPAITGAPGPAVDETVAEKPRMIDALGLGGLEIDNIEKTFFIQIGEKYAVWETTDADVIASLFGYFRSIQAEPAPTGYAGSVLDIRIELIEPWLDERTIYISINTLEYYSSPGQLQGFPNAYKVVGPGKSEADWEAFLSRCMFSHYDPAPPEFADRTMETAELFADYFVNILNNGRDLTGNDGAMDSWRALFDFGKEPIYRGELSEIESGEDMYIENVYQFVVYGEKWGIGNSATVWVNFQGDEPWYYCSYTYYFPYARKVAEEYIARMANGDVKQLAVWLSVDGGPEPSEEFVVQAERGLSAYSSYDLSTATITAVIFDNEAQRFICEAADALGGKFEITLSFGDGLIGPIRLE